MRILYRHSSNYTRNFLLGGKINPGFESFLNLYHSFSFLGQILHFDKNSFWKGETKKYLCSSSTQKRSSRYFLIQKIVKNEFKKGKRNNVEINPSFLFFWERKKKFVSKKMYVKRRWMDDIQGRQPEGCRRGGFLRPFRWIRCIYGAAVTILFLIYRAIKKYN